MNQPATDQGTSGGSADSVGPNVVILSGTPAVQARFTGWSLPAGGGDQFYDASGRTTPTTFRDCQLRGGALNFNFYPTGETRLSALTLINNLVQRTSLSLTHDTDVPLLGVEARNNLFRRGSVLFGNYAGTGAWGAYDNLFDKVTLAGEAIPNSHNAYYQTTALPGPGTGNRTLTSDPGAEYQTGPLGDYYYPETGGQLSTLIDAGSRSSAAAGLSCATTQVEETPDEDRVDIGFHYPILGDCVPPGSRGFIVNLEPTAEGYLRIKAAADTAPLPFVNVACSGRGTVARINVVPNPNPGDPSTWSKILGEYYTMPNFNQEYAGGDPSRTTVDRYGNVWVGNRAIGDSAGGSVTCIGVVIGGIRCNQDGSENEDGDYLKPDPSIPGGFIYNTCKDRDGDGLIRTSRGRKSDDSPHLIDWYDESLPAGDGDEAVIHYVRTTPTFVRSLAVDRGNNVCVGSREDGWQELLDTTTGVPATGEKSGYGSGGYGAVFDPYGVLWSAGYFPGEGMLWKPPGIAPDVLPGTAGGILPGTLWAYGIGIDPTTADVWLGDYWYGGLWQFKQSGCSLKHQFAPTGNPSGSEIKGIVGDGNGNIWVAYAKLSPNPSRVVYRFRNTGEYRGAVVLNHPTLPGVVGKSPMGVCIDSLQRVWAICFEPAEDGKYYAMGIDPTQGVDPDTGNIVGQVVDAVDLGTFPTDQGPYNYSDMSGFVTLAATQPAGFWDFVEDSGVDHMRWSTITVEAELNSGALIVEVRAADRVTDLPSWPFRRLDGSSDGLCLVSLGIKGRYLEVRATLLRDFGAAQSPVLKTLCVAHGTPGTALQITQHPKSAIVDRGGSTGFSVTATGTGLSYQWFKDGTPVGTGATLTINNAQYANAGKYHVRVTDSPGAFLDSADARLHVVSTPNPLYPRSIAADNPYPVIGQTVNLTASIDISPSPGPVYYQWRRNGIPIQGVFGLCDSSQNPVYTTTYSIESVACQHSGEYSVVFTTEYRKVAVGAATIEVRNETYNPVPLVHLTTSYPLPITDRHNPPTLTATACFTPICAQWYRTDSLGGSYFKELIPGANGMQYTFPNPVPCEMLNPWDYFMVEVFDEGRFRHASAPVRVYGDCEP